ncbi:MAG: hypothetical protein ACJ8C4_07100 [Gemmataceae bacterium]
MNEDDRSQIDDWIEKHGFDKCPQCGIEAKLNVSSRLLGSKELPKKGQDSTAYIVMTCTNCGLARLLNPAVVGFSAE